MKPVALAELLFRVVGASFVLGVLLLPTGSALARATDTKSPTARTATVKAVLGRVLFRRAFDVQWRPVRVGNKLPVGALVRLDEDARLTLGFFRNKAFAGLSSNEWELTFSRPGVERLSDEALRSVRASVRFSTAEPPKRVPPDAKLDVKVLKEHLNAGRFSAAWDAVLTLQKRSGGFQDVLASLKLISGLSSGVELRRKEPPLILQSPEPASFVAISQGSASIPVAWDGSGELSSQSYRIWLWRADEIRTAPLMETKLLSYVATVRRPGEYAVQVETSDGRRQSPIRLIKVGASIADAYAGEGQRSLSFPVHPFHLESPPAGFTWLTNKNQVRIDFVVLAERDTDIFDLIIEPAPGEVGGAAMEMPGSRVVTASLRPGRYTWYARPRGREVKKSLAPEKRTLEIVDIGGSDGLARALAVTTGGVTGGNRVVYLGEAAAEGDAPR